MIEEEYGTWEYVVAAVLAISLAVVLLGIMGEFHDIDVDLEAEGVANDLSSAVQQVADSNEGLSINHQLPADIIGHDYSVKISDNGVTIAVPDENVVKNSFYEGVSVEIIGDIEPGENLTITKLDGEVVIDATQ